MKNTLEEKRKEIFELHQSWLRPDVPLMRKTVPSSSPANPDHKSLTSRAASESNWFIIVVVLVTAVLVLLELVFFASELGWLK